MKILNNSNKFIRIITAKLKIIFYKIFVKNIKFNINL